MVKIAKKMMQRSTKEGKPLNSGLLEYRTISNTIPSLLEILMKRKPKTLLPQIPSCFQAFPQNSSRIKEQLMSRQDKQVGTAGSAITELEPGQPIWVLEPDCKSWKTAKVKEPAKEPNSCWVWFPDDSILRRTRVMLKPCSTFSYFELKAEQPGLYMELTPPIPLQQEQSTLPFQDQMPSRLPKMLLLLKSHLIHWAPFLSHQELLGWSPKMPLHFHTIPHIWKLVSHHRYPNKTKETGHLYVSQNYYSENSRATIIV